MSRRVKNVWASVFMNVGLPAYSDELGLSEPQYVSLLFDKHCTVRTLARTPLHLAINTSLSIVSTTGARPRPIMRSK